MTRKKECNQSAKHNYCTAVCCKMSRIPDVCALTKRGGAIALCDVEEKKNKDRYSLAAFTHFRLHVAHLRLPRERHLLHH